MRSRRRLAGLGLDAVYLLAGAGGLVRAAFRGRLGHWRDHLRRRVLSGPAPREGSRTALWVHGVSAGEVLAAARVVETLEVRRPELEVVVTASTRLGMEAATRRFAPRAVSSYPADLDWVVRRAFRRLRPDAVVVVEHDLWPNFLLEAAERGVPVALVNARLSERSFRGYRLLSHLVSWPPRSLALIAAQDEATAERFARLGFPAGRIRVTGNLKFDNPPPAGVERLREELGFTPDDFVLVAGSTHEGEEEAALEALARVRARHPKSFLVVAPRRTERSHDIARQIERRGYTVGRWSEAPEGAPGPRRGPDVLLLDTMGDLARAVALGDVVFVGGTLAPVGGHNVIEPASVGRAVIVGPHHENTRSVVEVFRERDAIEVVADEEAFADAVLALHDDPERRRRLGENAAAVVRESLGAAERTADAVEEALGGAGRER